MLTEYLTTLLIGAWNLDKDTHLYFREYLTTFINKRYISNDLREFVRDNRSRAINSGIYYTSDYSTGRDGINIPPFNELRISLFYRVFTESQRFQPYYSVIRQLREAPNLIEDIHPPKYYYEENEIY
tara:strand:+ start:255 stop:635 length:381 start_codon:yes stop_codon:yes gene_type:complete